MVLHSRDWIIKQPGVDTKRIALIGNSYGAGLVIVGCRTASWEVKTIVCGSATAGVFRMLEGKDILRKIPAGLYLMCDDEPKGFDVINTAERLKADTSGAAHLEIYEGSHHGQAAWANNPESLDLLADWLRKHL